MDCSSASYGLFILDDNKTPDIFTDDKFKKMLVMDTKNQVISFVYSIAEDLEGNIWVGTDQGPVIYSIRIMFSTAIESKPD